MSAAASVVFFDVDGVLLDSLPQHLQICRDLAKKFGLQLEIPDEDQFREMVSQGKQVSPMSRFFLAVGFPESHIEAAVKEYESSFAQKYQPKKFDGVDEMLARLRETGFQLGLVTSNTRANVEPALGHAMQCFDEKATFFFDSNDAPKSKPECLAEGVRSLQTDASASIYVGDQPADAQAADSAGMQFLGVTYGWGIPRGQVRFDAVDTVAEIPDRLADLAEKAKTSGGPMSQADRNLELLKLRLDYGWKWFSFHADQRTKMFNFMLVVVGISATAVVAAYKEEMFGVALLLCIATIVLAVIFILLDRRNRDLVWLGEDILRKLETKHLFSDDSEKGVDGKGREVAHGGILWRQTQTDKTSTLGSVVCESAKALREAIGTKTLRDAWLGKHRIWLRLIAFLIAALFLGGAFFLLGDNKATPKLTVPLLLPPDAAGSVEFARGWKALNPSSPFALGAVGFDEKVSGCPPPDEATAAANKWIATVVAQWKKRKGPLASDSLILIGSSDRISLNDRGKHPGGSNVGLARNRAETVKGMLVEATKGEPAEHKITAERIMVLVTGPRYWAEPKPGTKGATPDCKDKELRADRTVQVWIPAGT